MVMKNQLQMLAIAAGLMNAGVSGPEITISDTHSVKSFRKIRAALPPKEWGMYLQHTGKQKWMKKSKKR
jgi:hypothetical protein